MKALKRRALYRCRRTTKPQARPQIYPYPLGGMAITRSSILRIGYFPKESSI